MAHVMLFPMINVLYFYISTFRNMCAVLSMTVFCSLLNSCFSVVLLMYIVSDVAVVPLPLLLVVSLLFLHSTFIIIILIIIIVIYNGDMGDCMYSLCR
jgi:hypothetical protein